MIVTLLFLIIILSGCNGEKTLEETPEETLAESPMPVFSDVTVHDPSIFRVNDESSNDKFRIIGSFLRSAKTGDFISWQIDSEGGEPNGYSTALKYYPQDNPNPAVQTMTQQIEDVLRAPENDDLNFFASDIHRMPDGRFFHYYSLTSTWRCSAIGVAIANTVDGPYITQGLFVRSAEAGDNKAPDGSAYFNYGPTANNHPNCIDPQAFFDKTGTNFYMTYGSWSGGIFIYEMDTTTGLPKAASAMNAESNGYGRKLIAADHTAIEAPYIIYSPESDYYYLFVSYGGLDTVGDFMNTGRYHMRVFRSRNPEGPYEDSINTTAVNPNPLTSSNITNSGTTRNFRNFGVKIMGGYQFEHLPDENALSNAIGRNGFLSPGHNSAYYDPVSKKYFLIHHTRFVNSSPIVEAHEVRVREMFVNEDGWLIAAPFRYDGGTIRTFNINQLRGTWKIINHGRDINSSGLGESAYHVSQTYTFNTNGTIAGPQSGTWELKSDGKTAHITLGGKLYKGVFLRCWDEYHSVWVYAFTALSGDGIALWGATPGVATDLN